MAGDHIHHNSVDLQTSLEIRINDTDSTTIRRHQAADFLIRNGSSLGSEYEKMIVGSPFRVTGSPKLQAMKLQARRFCTNYNQDEIADASSTSPEKLFLEQRKGREELLHTIIGRVGEDAVIEPPFNFLYGCNISLGDKFYANVNLRIHDSGPVTIGDRVLIAPNVTIVTERHDKEIQSRRNGIVYTMPVSIGDDCWIGVGATILPGVSIGKGTVIGAGSLVTRDIPPFSVAWGVPARVIHDVDDPDAQISA
ncbi:Trimeric LpxA-like protein [Elaphomyces granulatus]